MLSYGSPMMSGSHSGSGGAETELINSAGHSISIALSFALAFVAIVITSAGLIKIINAQPDKASMVKPIAQTIGGILLALVSVLLMFLATDGA